MELNKMVKPRKKQLPGDPCDLWAVCWFINLQQWGKNKQCALSKQMCGAHKFFVDPLEILQAVAATQQWYLHQGAGTVMEERNRHHAHATPCQAAKTLHGKVPDFIVRLTF